MEPEYMTKEGYEKLLAKQAELEKKLFEAGQEAGDAAGASCDWHDNPGYDIAVTEMRIIARQLEEVTGQIRRAEIVENDLLESSPVEAGVGCRVTLDIEGDEEVYVIGGTIESNPDQGVISYKSPLGQAILGGRVGDTRIVEKPVRYEVKVLKIEKA